ncbi:MATE family efflux transporter [Pseudothermotoga elfii]
MKYSLIRQYLDSLETGKIRRELLSLGLPSMAENAMQMLFGMVDTAFLGHLSWQAMTGAGLANQLFFVLQVILIAASTGVTVLISNSTGARSWLSISRTLWNGIYLAAIWGFVLMGLGFFSTNLFKIFPNVDPAVFEAGTQYLRTILFGIMGMSLMSTLAAALRGSGDTKTPMIISAISNGLNVVLDYGMIYGRLGFPKLETTGAALATVISRFIGAALLFMVVLKSGRLYAGEKQGKKFHFVTVKNILSVGLPTAGENLLFSTGLLLFANILFMAGPMAYAGHRIGINIESISFMPGMGMSVAITALVGKYNGQGDLKKLAGVVRQGWILTTIFQVSVGIFIFFFPQLLIELFTNEAEIIKIAELPVKLIGMFQVFLALDYVMNGALRGTGNTALPMIITSISMWLVRLPLGYLLVSRFNLGLLGAWTGMLADMGFRSLLKMAFYLSGRWEKTARKTMIKASTKIFDPPQN